MCDSYHKMCIDRRRNDPLLYEVMPKGILNKIWTEVSKHYDTDDLYDSIGRDKIFSIDPKELKLTTGEKNWYRQYIKDGFFPYKNTGKSTGEIGIKIPYI